MLEMSNWDIKTTTINILIMLIGKSEKYMNRET